MSCLTSTGPTWCETVDRHAVNRWPSLREIRMNVPGCQLIPPLPELILAKERSR